MYALSSYKNHANTEIYSLSLHDALPICAVVAVEQREAKIAGPAVVPVHRHQSVLQRRGGDVFVPVATVGFMIGDIHARDHTILAQNHADALIEIGRASCRERGRGGVGARG